MDLYFSMKINLHIRKVEFSVIRNNKKSRKNLSFKSLQFCDRMSFIRDRDFYIVICGKFRRRSSFTKRNRQGRDSPPWKFAKTMAPALNLLASLTFYVPKVYIPPFNREERTYTCYRLH